MAFILVTCVARGLTLGLVMLYMCLRIVAWQLVYCVTFSTCRVIAMKVNNICPVVIMMVTCGDNNDPHHGHLW